LNHQIYSALFQDAGTYSFDYVLLCAIFYDYGIDAASVEEMG